MDQGVRLPIRVRFDSDMTAIRLPFDCISTELRPCKPTCVWAAALRPRSINNEVSVTAAVTLMTFDKQQGWKNLRFKNKN